MRLVVLTADAQDVSDVLPALTLLPYPITLAALTTSAMAASLNADALILDGRRDLVTARALCRAKDDLGAPPLLLVLEEGGFAVVNSSWGANDTVLFSAPAAEIQARLKMAIESSKATGSPSDEVPSGPVDIDARSFSASVAGKALDLTYREFELLHFLVEHPNQVISREELLKEVWGYDYFGGSRTVDVHVRRLRAKLGPEHEGHIITVRNVGYKYETRS